MKLGEASSTVFGWKSRPGNRAARCGLSQSRRGKENALAEPVAHGERCLASEGPLSMPCQRRVRHRRLRGSITDARLIMAALLGSGTASILNCVPARTWFQGK